MQYDVVNGTVYMDFVCRVYDHLQSNITKDNISTLGLISLSSILGLTTELYSNQTKSHPKLTDYLNKEDSKTFLKDCNIEIENSITRNSMYLHEDGIKIMQILKSIRNSLSHPVPLVADSKFPVTGWKDHAENKCITHIEFIHSPDISFTNKFTETKINATDKAPKDYYRLINKIEKKMCSVKEEKSKEKDKCKKEYYRYYLRDTSGDFAFLKSTNNEFYRVFSIKINVNSILLLCEKVIDILNENMIHEYKSWKNVA